MMLHKKFLDNTETLLKLGNNPIENVKEMKYIGIAIDHKFHWKNHIPYLSSKPGKFLCGFYNIYRNNYGINSYTAKIIYNYKF